LKITDKKGRYKPIFQPKKKIETLPERKEEGELTRPSGLPELLTFPFTQHVPQPTQSPLSGPVQTSDRIP
jgi:hypothetical protein